MPNEWGEAGTQFQPLVVKRRLNPYGSKAEGGSFWLPRIKD